MSPRRDLSYGMLGIVVDSGKRGMGGVVGRSIYILQRFGKYLLGVGVTNICGIERGVG